MKKEGFRWTKYKKGLYLDGHERPDVVEYRQKQYIPKFKEYISRSIGVKLVNGLLELIPVDLDPGVRPIVIIFHDESTYQANDISDYSWVSNNEHKIRLKGVGRGVMISGFLDI